MKKKKTWPILKTSMCILHVFARCFFFFSFFFALQNVGVAKISQCASLAALNSSQLSLPLHFILDYFKWDWRKLYIFLSMSYWDLLYQENGSQWDFESLCWNSLTWLDAEESGLRLTVLGDNANLFIKHQFSFLDLSDWKAYKQWIIRRIHSSPTMHVCFLFVDLIKVHSHSLVTRKIILVKLLM